MRVSYLVFYLSVQKYGLVVRQKYRKTTQEALYGRKIHIYLLPDFHINITISELFSFLFQYDIYVRNHYNYE